MRPSLIEIEGLQSFIKNQVIDFRKINQNGLFGIFGNTGSGKSTILDAITLALYGKVKRAGNTKQGIININCNVARVKFTFGIANDMYRVEREYKRKKGSDTIVESKVVRLIKVDEECELPVCDKEEAVNKKIEEIIGLTHKDFTKAVVLPQNNFHEFLLLGNSDRRKMLERVFYLEEYGQELSKKISDKMSFLKEQMDELFGELKRYEDSSNEAVILYKRELDEATNKKDESEVNLREVEKEYKSKKEIFDFVAELKIIESKIKILSEKDDYIEKQKEKLELASKAVLLEERLNNVLSLHKLTKDYKKEFESYEDNLSNLKDDVEKLSKKYDILKSELSNREELQNNINLELEIGTLKKDILILSKKGQQVEADINRDREKIFNISDEITKLQYKYDVLKKSEIDNMCIFIAQNLKDGDICPICGNTYKENKIKNFKDISINVNSMDEINKKLSDFNIKKEGLIAKIKTSENFLKEYKKDIKEKTEVLNNSLKDYETLLCKYGISSIKEELDKMNKKEKDIRQIEEKLREYDFNLQKIVNKKMSVKIRFDTYFAQYEKESEILKIDMADKGFSDTNKIRENILQDEARKNIEQEVEKHKIESIEIWGQKKSILKKINGREITDEEWTRIDNNYNEALARNKECTTKYDIAKDLYNRSKEKNKEWKKFKEMYKVVSIAYEKHSELRELLNGDRGKDNSFIDYIAEERLRYVAKKASEILGVMTQYRFSLILDTESGFRIIDNRNGGISRNVNTLSGGETFLTSLALALALSEQIQLKGKSPLEFFFLDEGFGSLDNELLDLVIDALERISKKERVIGIISHIPELRQRISQRVIVKAPTSDGVGSVVSIERA